MVKLAETRFWYITCGLTAAGMKVRLEMREHGFLVQDYNRISINLYPSPMVYVDGYDDHDNPKCEQVWDWAVTWTERAKLQFPMCTFSVGTGIHDSDYRVYAEIRIVGGDCQEAAEWLKFKTE